MNPFNTSHANVIIPAFLPTHLKTFVVPELPDPIVHISTLPIILENIYAKGIDPQKYEIKI
jgi:hypothetical protein